MEEKTKKGEYWAIYENFKGEIASDSRPIFFYGPNTPDRVEFVKKIASEFPFSEDPDKRYVLYADDVGLVQKEGEEENPKLINYYDLLARDYLRLGMLKRFIEDVRDSVPDRADRLVQEDAHLRTAFGRISVTGMIDKMAETMKVIKDSYASPPNNPSFLYNNGEMSVASFMCSPQEIIGSFGNRRGKSSFVLDIKNQLVPASMHSINDLVSDRDATRIILPQEYVWGYVRPDEKHQAGHDYEVDYFTQEAEEIGKRKIYNNGNIFS